MLISVFSACNLTSSSQPTTTSTSTTQKPTTTTAKVDVIPLRVPKNLGTMTMGKLFYKPKQAATIYKINTLPLSADYIAALRCLQGLVARTYSATIYLENTNDDAFWSNYTATEYGLVFEDMLPANAFIKFKDKITTFVLYNEANAYEYEIAQTYASLNDGIAVTKAVSKILKPSFPATTTYNISTQFKNKKEANAWAISNLLEKCEKNYIGLASRTTGFNDYIYAVKAFAISFDPKIADDVSTLKTVFKSNYKMPAVVFGDLFDLSELCSASGFAYINTDALTNGSFFASAPTASKSLSQPKSVDKKATDGQIYASFCVTDNDKLTSNQTALRNILSAPIRGSTPLGVEINPALFEIAPPIISWYYSNSDTSTIYVSSSCGYSSINPATLPAFAMEGWQATNNFFLQKADISVMVLSKKPVFDQKFKSFVQKNDIDGYIDCCDKEAKYFETKPFVSSNIIKDIKNKKDYKLTANPGVPTFICFYITASELGNSPFETLDNLVKQYQAANPGVFEFLLPNDLLATIKGYEDNKAAEKASTLTTKSQ